MNLPKRKSLIEVSHYFLMANLLQSTDPCVDRDKKKLVVVCQPAEKERWQAKVGGEKECKEAKRTWRLNIRSSYHYC